MQGKKSAGWKESKINWPNGFLNLRWDKPLLHLNSPFYTHQVSVSKLIQRERGRITWDWIYQKENFPKLFSKADTSAQHIPRPGFAAFRKDLQLLGKFYNWIKVRPQQKLALDCGRERNARRWFCVESILLFTKVTQQHDSTLHFAHWLIFHSAVQS